MEDPPPEAPSLPPAPSAMVGITPEKEKGRQFKVRDVTNPINIIIITVTTIIALISFDISTGWRKYVSGFCYVCFYYRAPCSPICWRKLLQLPFFKTFPRTCIFFHVWESLRKYKFPISLQYILNPDTPRPPQMLGLATVKSFVCGGGLASCHMYLRPSVCHIDRRILYIFYPPSMYQ